MAQDRKFVNGFFARRVWVGDNDNQLFSIGLKKDDFIKQIQAIPADDKGFINLTMGSQKADPTKMSLFEKEERQQQGSYKGSSNQSSYNKPKTSTPPPPPPPADDDLPF